MPKTEYYGRVSLYKILGLDQKYFLSIFDIVRFKNEQIFSIFEKKGRTQL